MVIGGSKISVSGFRVCGFRGKGYPHPGKVLGFGVWGLKFRVLGFRVIGGSKISVSGFRVLGFRGKGYPKPG